MPIDTFWYQDHRVIEQQLRGRVTIEEVAAANRQLQQMVEAGTPLVHVLVDMRQVESYPTNLHQLSAASVNLDNNQLGWTLCMTSNDFMRYTVSVLNQVRRSRFRLYTHPDEALAFLQDIDVTLDPLLPDDAGAVG